THLLLALVPPLLLLPLPALLLLLLLRQRWRAGHGEHRRAQGHRPARRGPQSAAHPAVHHVRLLAVLSCCLVLIASIELVETRVPPKLPRSAAGATQRFRCAA